MKLPFKSTRVVITAILVASAVSGCVSDHSYDVDNIKDVDATVTLFSSGLEFPLGKTDTVTVSSALKLAKSEALDSLLVADPKTGAYAMEAKGDYNLDKVIEEMHLDKLRDIDGASVSKDVEYKIGEIDPSQFTIDGKSFNYESEEFEKFDLDDIPVPSVTFPDQTISTGLYKYLPSDMDLGKKIGNIGYSEDIMAVNDLKAITDQLPYPLDQNVPVQTALVQLGKDSKTVNYTKNVSETLDLGENASQIQDIRDFVLRNGGTLKVDIEVKDVPLNSGSITPDIDMDLSSMFNLSGAVGGKVNLSDMEVTATASGSSYKSTKEITITSLADNFPTYSNGKLNLSGNMSVNGTVRISDAVSSKSKVNSLAGKTMSLALTASFNGVVIETMEITLGEVKYDVPDSKIDLEINYVLPEAIKTVKKIYLDTTKVENKFTMVISADGLKNITTADGNGHLAIKPYVYITFPEGIEIEGDTYIAGDDLFEGPVARTFSIVSITPTCSDQVPSTLTYKGTVTATVMAKASGSFSSKYLPKIEAEDVTVTAKMGCTPKLVDYDVTLNKDKMARSVDVSEEFSFELEGMSDFGTFRVNLQGSNVATLDFTFPATTEANIVADNIVISIPDMIVIDGSGLQGWDSGKNALTLNGEIPSQIKLPIQYLKVTPKQDESGKTKVTGILSIKGGIATDNYDVTRVTFDELAGKKVTVAAVIPSMKAASIELEGDFCKSLDYDIKDVVILDSKTLSQIPKEIQHVTDISFEGVKAIIELTVRDLPDMQGDFYMDNTTITLPEFMVGESGTNVLTLDNHILVENNQTIRQEVGLTHIKDVQLAGITELKGDILFRSQLTSRKPTVDISTLKGTIKSNVCMGVGNGSKATAPGKIVIGKAEVSVGYTSAQTQGVTLGEIPAELQAEDVNLGLNPNLYIELTTNFGAPVKGEFVITPFIGGKALEAEAVKITGIELPASEDWNKTLTNKYAIGSDVSSEEGVTVIRKDLSGLVKRIPDSLQIAMNIATDSGKDCIIYPAAAYSCSMNYKFSIPISFSKDFNINLNPEVAVDSSTSNLFNYAIVCLKGKSLTTLPIGVDCNIKLLDPNDIEIELNKPATLKILPSSDGRKVSEQEFEVTLDIKDRENAKVRKIVFALTMSSSPDVNLTEDQFIQILDLKAVLPSGVSFNFNE